MISGSFREGHPRLRLSLNGHSGSVDVDFILDTGFNGELVLPRHLLDHLDASPAGHRTHALADGSRKAFALFDVSVEWFGEERVAAVLVMDGEPLIGTMLLNGTALEIEVVDGGAINVSEL